MSRDEARAASYHADTMFEERNRIWDVADRLYEELQARHSHGSLCHPVICKTAKALAAWEKESGKR